MKITVTGTRGIPNIMGGIETHCEELFPRIVKKGFDVTIIRRKSYVKDYISEYKGIKLIDIETPKKKIFRSYYPYFQSHMESESYKNRHYTYSRNRSCTTYSNGKTTWHESCIYSSWT